MNITLCGSLAFFDDMEEIRLKLESMGHEVKGLPVTIADEDGVELDAQKRWEFIKEKSDKAIRLKEKAMRMHFEKVAWADAVLIVNNEKKGIPGYIGMNTMLEMGIAFNLRKKIFLLNPVPEVDYEDEILGMMPMVIDGNLELIS